MKIPQKCDNRQYMRRKTNFKAGDVVRIRPKTSSGHKVLCARLWGTLPEDLDNWWLHEPEKYVGMMFPEDIGFISEKHPGGWFKILTHNSYGWIAKRCIEFAENKP